MDKVIDKINYELTGKFTKKKMANNDLIRSYNRLGMKEKAKRVCLCGSDISYRIPQNGSEDPKLYHANFCKDRLCALCAWRRSMKIFGQVSKIMDKIEGKYEYIFITLTVLNCSSEDLPKQIEILQKGFKEIMRSSQMKAIKGYFKSLEITHDHKKIKSRVYHPHIHAICAVNKSYFHSRDYISHKKLTEIWREKCKLDYDPSVKIKKVVPKNDKKDPELKSIKGAVCETAKYTIKPGDITRGSYDEIDRAVLTYSNALRSKRICSFGGIFKEVAAELKLDDMIDGDLINTDNEQIRRDIANIIVKYKWQIGIGYQYETEYILEEEKGRDYQTTCE